MPLDAFTPKLSGSRRINFTKANSQGKDQDEDPTKVWYAGIADGIQNLLTNSPLNEGKKALVKSLAGEYDEVAVREKLNDLIEKEPVLMLSFTK